MASNKQPITSVRIGAIDYEVEFIEDLRDETGKLDGRIGYSKTKIQLDADMSAQATVQALLHEVIHAITMHMGKPKESRDESFIDAMAHGFYQVMRDNADLVRMITRK